MGFDEHAEFLDLSVINLPKYEAIIGEPWLHKWNPVIDWQKITMVWKMGKRKILVSRVQDPQSPELISSLFQRSCTVETISAQRMRKLAKKEPVYLAVVKTTNEDAANVGNEPRNDSTLSVNEDKTQTSYPMQVQAILNDFADVFPKEFACRVTTTEGVRSPY